VQGVPSSQPILGYFLFFQYLFFIFASVVIFFLFCASLHPPPTPVPPPLPPTNSIFMSFPQTNPAERAVSILHECCEKLQFLGAIAPDVLQHRDELTAFVGGEISRIIAEQRELENRYEQLITERGALKGLSNKTKYKSVQSEIQDVSHALRNSTKSLCRNLKDNPNIAGNLVKIHRERTELIDILTSSIAELQASGAIETLVNKVNADKASQEYQKLVMTKERETAAAVKQLDKDLTVER